MQKITQQDSQKAADKDSVNTGVKEHSEHQDAALHPDGISHLQHSRSPQDKLPPRKYTIYTTGHKRWSKLMGAVLGPIDIKDVERSELV